MKHIITLFLVTASFIFSTSFAQTNKTVDAFASYFSNLKVYNHLYPQEKVFVHFDNSGYYVGEKIWFKAYVVISSGLTPTPLSKVLYVELIDQYGKVEQTKKIKIENGQCHGEFDLNNYYKSGFYEVRAYTRVMLNNGKETAFSRVLPIFEMPKKEGEYNKVMRTLNASNRPPYLRDKESQNSNLNCSFYPEGGNIIAGNLSRVAFKASDKNGLFTDISGSVISSSKDTVAQFNSFHDGMGAFYFFPEINKKYEAVINYNGKNYSFNLPEVKQYGYTITCNNSSPDNIVIKIERPEDMPGDTIAISLLSSGLLNYANLIDLKNSPTLEIYIPKAKLNPGVSQITLFNRNGNIEAERLVFNKCPNEINIDVKSSGKILPLSQVILDLNITDKDNNPVSTSLSLSVKDGDNDIYTTYNENIYSNLLLSSDIKGYINNPGYYFEQNDIKHNQALDLLMMVQGWRRYDWNRMAMGRQPEINNFTEDSLIISGKVESVLLKKVKKNVLVKADIYPQEAIKITAECITDQDGTFNFVVPDFYGKSDMLLSLYSDNKRINGNILIDRTFSPKPKAISEIEKMILDTIQDVNLKKQITIINEEDNDDFTPINDQLNANNKVLETVDVTAEELKWERTRIMKSASVIYDITQEKDNLKDKGVNFEYSLFDFLKQISTYFSFSYFDGYSSTYKGRKCLYIVDDLTIEDPSPYKNIYELNIDLIEKIAICDDQTTYATYYPSEFISDSPVLISVYLKRNHNFQKTEKKGERRTVFYGYSSPQEFYVPENLNPALIEDIHFRRTLYWNPNLKTDSNGKATVKFFNNNSCKDIVIDAQTITNKGVPGSVKL